MAVLGDRKSRKFTAATIPRSLNKNLLRDGPNKAPVWFNGVVKVYCMLRTLPCFFGKLNQTPEKASVELKTNTWTILLWPSGVRRGGMPAT